MTVLVNKRIIVTGATSGLGRAIARDAAKAGARLVVTGRREAEAMETVSHIEIEGGEAIAVTGDLRSSSFADRLIETAVRQYGGLDGLVNAAGMIVRSTAEATSDDDWHEQMSLNVDSVFYASRAAVPVIREGLGGSIVNIASTCGKVGAAGLAGYCASKGAVISLTQAMALEHAEERVRINSVSPGAVDTPMLAGGHPDGVSVEQVKDRNIESIPQGRIPEPAEIAQLVTFLLSDASTHITGTDIAIDGGYTAQ